MINDLTLSDFINPIGRRLVFAGDPFTASGMEILGAIEGAVTVNEGYTMNNYTTPELTGDAVHESEVQGSGMTLDIPLILGNEDLYAKISPTGSKNGGFSSPQPVVETSLIVIPQREMPNAGLTYNGTVWTPTGADANLKNMITIWRGFFNPGSYGLSVENGGKVIRTVTFTAMFYDANPEGHKLWTRGNPVAQGITNFRL